MVGSRHVSDSGIIRSAVMALAFVSVSSAFAAAPATNIWTGAGGDFNWSNMANWSNADGVSDPIGCASGCVWDLTAFPAGGTLTDDFAGDLIIRGLVFGGNKGTVTLLSKNSSSPFKFINGQSSTDDHTWITVPQGTKVDFCLRHTDEWKQWYTHLRGGGTFRVNGFFKHVTVGRFFLEDITFIVGENWSAKTPLLIFQLESDDSVMVFEQDREFGEIWSKTATISPRVYLNGHICNLRRMMNSNYSMQIASGGTIGVCNGWANTFAGSFAADTSVEFALYNGDLLLGSAGSAVFVPAGSSVNFIRNSRFGIFADQTLASVSSVTPEGGVMVAEGATLTVAGAAATTNSLSGIITGGGNLEVAGGAGYEFKMSGSSDYTGATHIKAGTLKTVRPKSANGLVAYWNFEADESASGAMDVSSAEPMTMTTISGYAYPPSVVAGGAGGGGCAHFDCDPTGTKPQNMITASPRPDRFYAMSNDYSVVMYLKPDGRTMVKDASVEGVEFYEERPMSWMHIFYNAWVDYGMNWVYFNGQRHIRFSGTGNAATGDYAMAIPSDIDMFDGYWHQLAWTYDRSSLKICIYIDGRLVSDRTRTTDFSLNLASGLRFGVYGVNDENNRKRAFDGDMDNIQIWSRALSAGEISADWRRKGNIAGDKTIVKPTPVAHWTFDDANDLGKDSSGNGFHLTAVKGSGTGVVAAPAGCPGVNGGAASLPTLVSSKGSHLELVAPSAPFPSGTHDYTITIRLMPRHFGDAEHSAFFFFGGGEAVNSVRFWQRNWVPYLSVTAYGWGWIDDGNQATTDYNYGYFHLSGANISKTPDRSYWFTAAFSNDHANRKMKIYRDGVLIKTWSYGVNDSPKSGVGDTPSFYLGYSPIAGAWMPEYVDDCRVYDRALTEGEIAEISRELCNGDGTVTDEVLPPTTAVTVDAGATLSLGANQTLASIAGSGSVDLFAADLTLTGASSFAGALTGGGNITVQGGGGLALTGDGSAYAGKVFSNGGKVTMSASYVGTAVTVQEGAVFTVAANDTAQPLISAVGTVTLPATATIAITGYAGGLRKFIVAEGGTLEAPQDFSGWSVTGTEGNETKFRLDGNCLILKVGFAGSQVILR